MKFLLSRKVNRATIHRYQLGYYNKSELSRLYDRVLFPIFDPYGNFCFYQGRALYDYEAAGTPKYWHESFEKSGLLYGLHECADIAIDAPFIVLNEGPMDVLSLACAGIPAVASLGTTFSEEQAYLIRRYNKNVCIWRDADSAGIKARQHAVPILQSVGLEVSYIGDTGEFKDPSDMWERAGLIEVARTLNERFAA